MIFFNKNLIISNRYKAVKRDNDSVYFEKVPTLTSLSAVQGAIVAKPQLFDCHDADVSGPDIFQKLVPMVIKYSIWTNNFV
jgi:tyrosine-protein phosphatase non-receptor type 23